MSSGKDKTLPEKLKQFFKFAKSPAPAPNQSLGPFPRLKVEKFLLTRDVEHSISKDAPAAQRLKALQEIGELVATKRIEENASETIYLLINDLFVHNSVEERHTALMFLKNLIMGQYERLDMLRGPLFDIVRESTFNEDICILIELLKSMTDNGKNLLHMEEKIGLFLLHFLQRVSRQGPQQSQQMKEFLPFLLNVVKFNSAYVDANVIDGIVRSLCCAALTSHDTNDILLIISVFDTVICYSNLPNESIVIFTSTLCRLVNNAAFSRLSWKVMRNLIGTHLGTTTLYTLIHCLQTSDDATLLRGAIFFIGMVLSPDRPSNCPSCPAAVILPAFNEALKHSDHVLVLWEMGLTLEKLVSNDGATLVGMAWDWVVEILHHFLRYPEEPKIRERFLKILADMEQLVDRGVYSGSIQLFFNTLERALPLVGESSVLRLMDFQAKKFGPGQPNWISALNRFVQR